MFKNIVVAITANTTGLAQGMSRANAQVASLDKTTQAANVSGRTLGQTLAKGVAVAAVAVGVALGASVMKAKEFDEGMRNVNSIAKMSEEQFAATSQAVLDISTRLPQSAEVLAAGLYDIASSGFAGAEGLVVLEASATAAAAGLTDTDVAAKAITGVLNAYGREAGDAADVSDTLFKAVEVGVLTFEDLSSNLGSVIGLSSAAGVEIDEVAAALAAMTLAGVGTAEASTSLTRLIQGMIDPSDDLAKKFNELGYESGQAALDQLGLHGVMSLLQDTTDGSVESWMALFPEIRAARGAFALTAAEGENYNTTAEAIIDVNSRTGATSEALAEQMKSLSMQWDLFASSVNAGLITVGTKLLPFVIDLLNGFQDLVGVVAAAAKPFVERLIPAFEAAWEIAKDLWSIARQVTEVLGPMAGAIAGVVAAVVIDALVMFVETLASVVSWVEESNAALPLMAGILTAMLLPALAGVVTKLQVMAVMGLVRVIEGIAGGFYKMAGGLTAVNVAAGVIGILAAAAMVLYTSLKKAESEAEELAKSLREAFSADIDTSTQQGQLDALNAELEGLTGRARELREEADQGVTLNFTDNFSLSFSSAAQDALIELDAVEGELSAVEEAASAMNTAISEVTLRLGEMGVELDPEGILSLADAMGIDLATAGEAAIQALVESAAAASEGQGEFADLATEFDTVAGATARMAQALNDYVDALRGLFDPVFAAQTAVLGLAEAQAENDAALKNMIDSQEKADEAVRKFGKGSDEAKEAIEEAEQAVLDFESSSRDLAKSVVDSEAALNDLYQSVMEGGGTMEDARQAVFDMVQEWVEAGTVSPEAAAVMLDSFGMVFDEVDGWVDTTADKTINVDRRQFDADMAELDSWSRHWDEDTPTSTPGMFMDPVTGQFERLHGLGEGWENSNPTTTPGMEMTPAEADSARLTAMAEEWANSNPTTTPAARTADAASGMEDLMDRGRRYAATNPSTRANLNGSSAMTGFRTLRDAVTGYSRSNPRTSVTANTSNAVNRLSGVLGYISRIPRNVTTTVRITSVYDTAATRNALRQADGGIVSYYADGGRTEDHVAQIAPAGAWRVWAEPETGGEAYIPMAPEKRGRSQAILGDVAKQFGYSLQPMARGGTLGPDRAGPGGGRQQVFNEGSIVVTARDERRVASDLLHELRWVGVAGGGRDS